MGRIPQLEEALAQASAVRGEAEQANDEVKLLSAERAGLARRKEQLEAELETHKALARRELNRKLRQVQAELAQAELDLHDTTLVAPSDGTLMTRALEPGSMLNAGSTVLTLSLTRPVWVRAYIDEPNLGQMQPGRELLLYTDGRPDKPYHGKVGFVSPTAEFTPKTVETPDLRTDLVYRLRIIVTDADDALRQGMPVTVKVNSGERHE